MQAWNDDDLHRGQRSSEVKCGKLCAMATIFGQKNCWCMFKMMMTFMEVKGQMGSNIVNYVPWLQTWSEDHWWQWWLALRSKVNGGQIWQSMLHGYHIWSDVPLIQVKDDNKLHGGHRKIIKGHIVNHAIWLSNFARRTTESIWGQSCPTEVKCSKVCFTTTSLDPKHQQSIEMVTTLNKILQPNLTRALAKGTVTIWSMPFVTS